MLPQVPVILWQVVVHENVGSSAVCEGPKSLQIIRLAHSDARLEPHISKYTASWDQTCATQPQGSHTADKHIACV